MFYEAYGAVLQSTLPLPELRPRRAGRADLVVADAPGRLDDRAWTWQRPGEDADPPYLAVAKGPGGYRLRFADGAEFVFSAGEKRIDVVASAPDEETIRHLVIDQVVPLALAQFGRFVLHASAVAAPQGAVAFVGPTGAGKSTLAASFGLHGRAVVADDALVVERRGGRWLARPAYPGVRVWPAIASGMRARRRLPRVTPQTDKRRLGAGDGLSFASGPLPLARIYVPDVRESESIAIRRLTPRDGLMALVANTYTLDAVDGTALVGQLDRARDLAGLVPIRSLAYPRRLTALAAVRAAVLADLSY